MEEVEEAPCPGITAIFHAPNLKPIMKQSGNFEDLFVWQDAIQLGKDIYSLFDKCTMYSIKSQIDLRNCQS